MGVGLRSGPRAAVRLARTRTCAARVGGAAAGATGGPPSLEELRQARDGAEEWTAHFKQLSAGATERRYCCFCGGEAMEAPEGCHTVCSCDWQTAHATWDLSQGRERGADELLLAERSFVDALTQEPENAELHCAYGVFLWHARDDKDGAKELFDRAVRLAPQNTDVLACDAYFAMLEFGFGAEMKGAVPEEDLFEP